MSLQKNPLADLTLRAYYVLEGVNSFACTLFLTCVMFWTQRRFGYSSSLNLWLNAMQGITYIVASRVGGALADRLGYDRQLRVAVAAGALILLIGWLPPWHATPFVIMTLYTITMGATWPALEAVILHAAGTSTMPQRVGIYNMTWALTGALGVFISGPLFAWEPATVFWLPGLLHLGQALYWWWGPRVHRDASSGSTAMELPHRGNQVAPHTKRRLLYIAWFANAVGYLLSAALFALAPFIGDRLGLSAKHAIWLVSTYLLTRGLGFVLFWWWEGWHYHAGWSLAAALLTPLSVAVVFLVPYVMPTACALAIFGVAHSLSYAGSLYYSVDSSEEKGAYSGLHEAIIGVGVFAGPLAGAAGAALWRAPMAAEITLITVAALVTLVGLGFVFARSSERRAH